MRLAAWRVQSSSSWRGLQSPYSRSQIYRLKCLYSLGRSNLPCRQPWFTFPIFWLYTARALYTSKMDRENSAQFFLFPQLNNKVVSSLVWDYSMQNLKQNISIPHYSFLTIFLPICSETLSLLLLLCLFSLLFLILLYYSLYIVIFLLILSLI